MDKLHDKIRKAAERIRKKTVETNKQWVGKTNSTGIIAKAGRYGGTYGY